MSDKTKEKVKCTIPIKVNSYEELFNPLDYRNLAERDINGEVHSWIEEYISRVPQKLSSIDVELLINMPEDAMDKDKEEKSKLGIINYYNSNKYHFIYSSKVIQYSSWTCYKYHSN